jgi:transaldolase
MKGTQALHSLGQSIWLDNIARDLLDSGTLQRYIDELSVTGLTSNPTIFDHAIKNSPAYDAAIREKEGLPAIEEAVFAGVAINVTLLFSREQYLAAAEAFLRGGERRIDAGLDPGVGSVASVFISRWDSAVMSKVPDSLRDQLGIAIAKRTYKAYRALLATKSAALKATAAH